MNEKIYLFKRAADGVWIYGPNADCEHPSGACRIIPNTARDKVSIIYLAKSDGKFDRNDVPVTSFYKEDGNAYADFAALKAGYAGFFFKPIYLTQEAADERYPQIADGQAAYVKECLGVSNSTASHTGNTNETTLFEMTIPGGKMGPNGYLDIKQMIFWTSNTNNKTVRIYLNNVLVGMGSSNAQNGAGQRNIWTIVNNGATNAQHFANPSQGVASGQFSGNVGSLAVKATSAIDTTQPLTLKVTAQCANAGDTITHGSTIVESVYQPAAS